MKEFASFVSILLIMLLTSFQSVCQKKNSLEGIYLGTLKLPNVEMRIAVTVNKNSNGDLNASFNSVDQGSGEIAFDSVFVKDYHVRLKSNVGLEIEGNFENDWNIFTSEFRQRPGKFPIVFKRVAVLPALKRPQEPNKPYPYKEEEISYRNEDANVELAGTLTIPEGEGPFPAVVLLTGSGPQNRNEELLGHKPFLVIADYLTRKGIAVLRSDDRGMGGSTGDFVNSTTEDFADDGLAAIDFLKNRKGIDFNMIGFVGHSEGGMMAPIAASKSKDVDFIVLLAGPGANLADNVIYQRSLLAKKRGATMEEIQAQENWLKQLNAIARKEISNDEVHIEIKEAYNNLEEEQKNLLNWDEKRIKDETERILQKWWRYGIRYNAVETISKLDCPILSLLGEKDLQVPASLNENELKKAIASGHKSSEVKIIDGVNHLFQTCETGDQSEYQKIEETISPVVLETISSWILNLK